MKLRKLLKYYNKYQELNLCIKDDENLFHKVYYRKKSEVPEKYMDYDVTHFDNSILGGVYGVNFFIEKDNTDYSGFVEITDNNIEKLQQITGSTRLECEIILYETKGDWKKSIDILTNGNIYE